MHAILPSGRGAKPRAQGASAREVLAQYEGLSLEEIARGSMDRSKFDPELSRRIFRRRSRWWHWLFKSLLYGKLGRPLRRLRKEKRHGTFTG